jgi:hypothetical protein
MKKLLMYRLSVIAVPAGGGLTSALTFLTTPGAITKGAREARDWCATAVAAIRAAREPNPWKGSTDEEIAGELLRRIEEKKR